MNSFKFLLPLIILIVANAYLFAGTFWNRSGGPTGEISFSQCAFVGSAEHNVRRNGRYLNLRIVSEAFLAKDADRNNFVEYRERGTYPLTYLLIQQGGTEWDDYVKKKNSNYPVWVSA